MRRLMTGALLAVIAACTGDGITPPPAQAPIEAGPDVVIYEGGPRVAQCAAPSVTLPQSASRLSQAGISVLASSCGVRTGVAYPAVCGAPTGEIIVHRIPASGLPQAQANGFQQADTLVDTARRISWRRAHCAGYAAFVELARSSSCAQTRNRLLAIHHPTQLDGELILLDQAGACMDAAYRQLLLGETVNDVLCSNAQTIAGPVKRCNVARYASLFDTAIANLDKADLGLGAGFDVIEIAL